ncbi:hypothetical protein BGZ73_003503 [Actinomortierella ambigua]|nr:hypothetical protein BGZ73_003503 [Actinomortierella ambigua]
MGRLPTTRSKAILRSWMTLRAHLSEHGKDSLKIAFENAPLLTLEEVTRLRTTSEEVGQEREDKSDEATIEIKQRASKRQVVQQSSGLSSNTTSASKCSSQSSRSSASRAREDMRKQYSDNLYAFNGKLWTATSGTVVDMTICSYVLSLNKESSLHSFVIDNAETVIQLFTDKDREEVAQILELREDERHDASEEQAFFAKYLSAPRATGFALSRGWLGSPEDGSALDDDKREWLYKAMHDIYTTYKCCAFRLPLEEKESWYITALWSFLLPFFNEGNALIYRPGETMSEASALRKNASRSLETRRIHGHKIDGLISSAMTQLELGGIEAGKTDGGCQSTKTLTDTRKLAKLLKDMHDRIVRKTDDEKALHELETFGLIISRAKMTMLRLRKLRVDGPHYQLVDHGSYSFPLVWDERGLAPVAITRLLIALVTLKKAMEAMDVKVAEWTIPGARFEHKVFIQTLDSPLRSSDADGSSDS